MHRQHIIQREEQTIFERQTRYNTICKQLTCDQNLTNSWLSLLTTSK